MLGVYTEETFNSLTKHHIIDLFLKIQKHTNSTICKLTDEIRNLNVNFKRLESDIQACKKVNDALVKQVVPPPQQKKRSDDSEISRTKDSEQVIKVKKGLKDLNPTDSDFPEGTRLFINDNLCHNYRVHWNKYKKLWINK